MSFRNLPSGSSLLFRRALTGAAALAAIAGAVASACPVGPCNPSAATGDAALDAAIESLAGGSALRRASLISAIVHSPQCFPSELTKEEWEEVLEQFPMLLPPTQLEPINPAERFIVDSTVWTGVSGQGPSQRAARTSLTYSFPDDGVTWGLSEISSTGANDLNSRLTTLFGAGNLDRGREIIRQSLASWRRATALSYHEVADNNSAMAEDVAPNPVRGDIRIGGLGFGTGSFLAYNAFPSDAAAGVGGGDMCFNTSFFLPANFNDSSNNYRYLRNTTAHEHGHGLGNFHVVPCNSSKLMEPSIQLSTDGVTVDETRGGQRNYGDRYAGNHSAGDAHDFGDITSPSLRAVVERQLSTNGATGFGDTNQDWFRFTISSTQDVVLSAAPTGGSYQNGSQLFSCFGFDTTTVNANNAGNLNIELRDSSGGAIILQSSSGGVGATETINANGLTPGEYTVRVVDVGPNANQTLQLYDLTIRPGAAQATPLAIAGIDKRIAADTNCFFMGDINSRANESGASIPGGGYEWDLDGDGVFETAGAQPMRQYVSNGVYDVTLRVTDSNGMSATDTITVTVFDATTTVTMASPSMGEQGQMVPVVITGTNLKNVANAAEVSVSGAGVTVVGTPVPNTEGTAVTGLSFVIDPGAAIGARDVSVSNGDGNGTGVGVFTVEMSTGAPCPADLDGDGFVGASDLAILLGSWGPAMGSAADLDNDGTVGATDLATMLGSWGACP